LGDKEELRKLLEEVSKRTSKRVKLDWNRLMFGPQREFILDESRFKAACCGRRAGKSHSIGLALTKACMENPGSKALYINMNRSSARNIIHPPIKKLNTELDLKLRFNNQTSEIAFPNDAAILVFGGGSVREMDKMRGIVDVSMICVDEAQGFGGDMNYMLKEVLIPSASDLQAPIMLTGTPNRQCAGPFYNVCHGLSPDGEKIDDDRMAWNIHHWTMLDNIHLPDPAYEMELAKMAAGWTDDSAGFRREYLGLWERDDEGLCFEMKPSMYLDRFDPNWHDDFVYILGVDLGTKDPCAFTTLAHSRKAGVTYVVESYRKGELAPTEAGEEIDRLRAQWKYDHIVADSGGQGASFIKQWSKSMPWIPAEPVEKGKDSVDMGVSLINADIRCGKIMFVKPNTRHLIEEMGALSWDEAKARVGKRVVKRGLAYPDHAADSFRYAYTMVSNYATNKHNADAMPVVGTSAYLEWYADKLKKEALKPDRAHRGDLRKKFWALSEWNPEHE
jgi:hypothetical protein